MLDRLLSRAALPLSLSFALFLTGCGGGSSESTIKVGEFASLTGKEATFGTSSHEGTLLAFEELNAAGGVLGKPVEWSPGDSGDTSTDIASQTTDRLLGEGVDAIIGAGKVGTTLGRRMATAGHRVRYGVRTLVALASGLV